MTKKHFEKAADIARTYPVKERAIVVQAFLALFSGENPAFNSSRFREACEPKPVKAAKSR